jgi:hypothetical protein
MDIHDFTPETAEAWGLHDPELEDGQLQPEPGLWADVPEAHYHRLPGLSSSRMKELMRSPAHLQAVLGTPHAPTDAQRFGTAAHLAVLQPELFTERVPKPRDIHRRTKAGKAEWAELCDEYGEANIFKPDDYAHLNAIRDAVHAHPVAGELLSSGVGELTAVWPFEVAVQLDDGPMAEVQMVGFQGKAKVDWIIPEVGVLIDLKTSRDAGADPFGRDFYTLGYFRQLAYYRAALGTLGLNVEQMLVVAVEKEPPYAVAVYEPEPMAIKAGLRQAEAAIELYAECLALGSWPGYPVQPQPLDLPHWAYSKL